MITLPNTLLVGHHTPLISHQATLISLETPSTPSKRWKRIQGLICRAHVRLQGFKEIKWKDWWLNQLNSYEAVCITAPATTSLLLYDLKKYAISKFSSSSPSSFSSSISFFSSSSRDSVSPVLGICFSQVPELNTYHYRIWIFMKKFTFEGFLKPLALVIHVRHIHGSMSHQ